MEGKGLAILGAVRAASAEEGGAALEDVAKRLAFCVREVEVRPDGAALGTRTQAALEALRGRPLTPAALFGLLDALVAEFPDGAQGFSVTVNRIGNDRGAVVRVHVVPLPRGRAIREGGFWEVRSYFRVRKHTADTWSSSGDGAPGAEDWESFREVAEATLLADVDAPVRIRVGIRRGLTRNYPDPIPLERILRDAGLDPGETKDGK